MRTGLTCPLIVVRTLNLKGTYNDSDAVLNKYMVVSTLNLKGTYNKGAESDRYDGVVSTLILKGTYNLFTKKGS